MKYNINRIKLALLALFSVAFFFGCQESVDPMAMEMTEANSKISGFDKQIAKPGDTVTVTGSELDKVFRVMLNESLAPVKFTATSSELKFVVPASAPLGDVVIVSFFFSGKSLAQKAIELFSPPQIFAISPVAAREGTELTIYGDVLYLTDKVMLGGVESEFAVIDEKHVKVKVPAGFAGGDLIVVTADGTQTASPVSIIHGTEILVTSVETDGAILSSYGPYSNAEGESIYDAFPRDSVFEITIIDGGSSWGANCDFNFVAGSLPADIDGTVIDLTKVEMVADVKASKNLSFNFMLGKSHNPPGLWGKSVSVGQEWQTITVPLSELGQGYGGAPITDDPLIPFEQYTMIKWSLPAQASAGNFGETITFDNVKFIIRE